jgi:hypothetical protein
LTSGLRRASNTNGSKVRVWNETGFTAFLIERHAAARAAYVIRMTTLTEIRTRALASLIPPPRLHFSEWIEREIVLPEGVSALPGAWLWPYQRDIADAITDPACERVTLLKPTRVGEAPRLRLAARAAWP